MMGVLLVLSVKAAPPASTSLHLKRDKTRPQTCGALSFYDTEETTPLRRSNNRLTFATQEISILRQGGLGSDLSEIGLKTSNDSYLWHTHYPYDLDEAELIISPRRKHFSAKAVVCVHENTADLGKAIKSFSIKSGKEETISLPGLTDKFISVVLSDLRGGGVQFGLRLRRPNQGKTDAHERMWTDHRTAWEAHPNSTKPPEMGFADLHNHQASNLAFGGDIGHGYVHGSHADPLQECDGKHAVLFGMGTPRHTVPYGMMPEEWWPHASDGSHAQTHATQLKAAFARGLKLLGATAVANESLCALQNPSQMARCDDMDAALNQIMALRKFARENSSWYRIVRDPWEARKAISDNRLAVVLGLELSDLMPEEGHGRWREQLDELYDLGVRSIELAHEADSRFAGSAHQQGFVYKVLNKFEGAGLSLEEKVDAADLPDVPAGANAWARHSFQPAQRQNRFCNPEDHEKVKGTGIHCNSQGLTDDGRELVPELMKRHMMIPLDHMSRRARSEVCSIALKKDAYPLYASHTRPDVLHQPAERTGGGTHEYMMTEENLDCIQATGGVVGIRPSDHALREVEHCINKDLTCWGSAESVAQNFCYGAHKRLALAIGSDFSGPVAMMAPSAAHDSLLTQRLDGLPAACRRNVEMGMVTPFGYRDPARAPDNRSTQIEPTDGDDGRILHDNDYRVRGLAHTGFLPDALAELEKLGAPLEETRARHSAESFLRMWERQFMAQGRKRLDPDQYAQFMGTRRWDKLKIGDELRFKKNAYTYNPVSDNLFKRCMRDRAANLGTCNEEADWEERTLKRLKADGWRRRHCGCRVVGEPSGHRGYPAAVVIALGLAFAWARRRRTAS